MTSWTDITTAVGTALRGDRVAARRELTYCWDGLGEHDHAQRCVVAHYLADVQDDLSTEATWDEAALAAFALVGEDAFTPIGVTSAARLAPSLYLNLGACCQRQGRTDDARRHLEAGLATASALGDDGYARTIRSGLDGLRTRLEACS